MMLSSGIERMVERLRERSPIAMSLELWDGQRFEVGRAPTVFVRLKGPRALGYFLRPSLDGLGEAYVEGHIDVEGPLHEVIRVGVDLAVNSTEPQAEARLTRARHTREEDRKAIEYHYDVSNDFYRLFLDRAMVYSCAYFGDPADSLDLAQERKLDHILRKLRVQPGERLLDIGCGWGALILRAAKVYGAVATGVTLSRQQHDFTQERIRAEGLADRCSVQLCDYRDIDGDGFDKVASVGMFEHVGIENLPLYFAKIRDLLAPGGMVLNHGITSGTVEESNVTCGGGDFIERYVFPHGELPHLSRAIRDMSDAGLEVVDVESLRRHYARTCRAWADRLQSRIGEACRLAGERRSRIWRIYLAGCAYAFERGWINVHQVLACKAKDGDLGALPLTRDYMYEHTPV
jgi:cyclopropane-fatty-acyl-phospholipid synthase